MTFSPVVEKFLRYIAVDTQSSETSGTHPSTEKQKDLGRMLVRELEAMGVVIPVIAARGNFKIFLRFDDPFAVEMRMTFYNGVRMTVAYEVRNTDTGELCYDGETEHCFVSNPDYKPLALKKKFPQLHEKLMAVLEKPEKGK